MTKNYCIMVRINGHSIIRVNDVYCLYDKVGLLPMFDSLRDALFYVLVKCVENGH